MRRTAVIAVAFAVLASVPVLAEEASDRIRRGIARNNAGDFDAAIAIFDGVLVDHPHLAEAVLPKALSMLGRGDFEQAVAFIEAELASGVKQSPSLRPQLGWAYQVLNQPEKAEATYREAFPEVPGDPDFNYNSGINLMRKKRWADAMESLVMDVRGRPDHWHGWYVLAYVLEENDREPRAFFALARVVAAEPTTLRGKLCAARLWDLLFHEVDTREIDSIKLEPDSRSVEAMLFASVAASQSNKQWAKKSDAAFFAGALDALTSIAAELDGDNDPYWNTVLPFFRDAQRDKHLECLAYVIRRAAGDDEAGEWLTRESKKLAAYSAWAEEWKRANGVGNQKYVWGSAVSERATQIP